MKNLTEVVFILDRSGSMCGLEADTIGGFNGMLEKQRKEGNSVLVSTILFDDECQVIHDRLPLEEVKKLTDKEYYVRGCTALLDAVGGAIQHISKVHKYIRKEDCPDKVLFVITTDGMENSSRKFNYHQVKELIEGKQKTEKWEFLFLGANIDAVAEAGRLGIMENHAARYCCDSVGTKKNFEAVGNVITDYCFGATSCSDYWKNDIAEYQQEKENNK